MLLVRPGAPSSFFVLFVLLEASFVLQLALSMFAPVLTTGGPDATAGSMLPRFLVTGGNQKKRTEKALMVQIRRLLGAPGLTTRSKDATRAPGIATRGILASNKKLLGWRPSLGWRTNPELRACATVLCSSP